MLHWHGFLSITSIYSALKFQEALQIKHKKMSFERSISVEKFKGEVVYDDKKTSDRDYFIIQRIRN